MKNLLVAILLLICFKTFPGNQIVLKISANYLAYSKFYDRLYASVSGTDLNYGNQLLVINPHTGEVESSIYVGSEPSEIKISSDNAYMYIILKGSPKIIRLNLNPLSIDKQILINKSGTGTQFYAKHMAMITGRPKDIVVSRMESSYPHDVFLYKDGIPQTDSLSYFPAGYKISVLLSGSDPETIFGYNDESSGWDFSSIKIIPTGLHYINSYSNLLDGFVVPTLVDDMVYTSNGDVVDPFQNPPIQIAKCVLQSQSGAQGVTVNKEMNKIIYGQIDFWQSNLLHIEMFSNTLFNLKARQDIVLKDLSSSTSNGGLFCMNATLTSGLAFIYGGYSLDGRSIVILPDSTGNVATKQVFKEQEVSFYPNPVANSLNIKGNFEYAEILNNSGQSIARVKEAGMIDVSSFPQGFFFVRVIYSDWSKTYKLIKK